MDLRVRFVFVLLAAAACTNAAVAPGPAPGLPWQLVLVAFVLWLVSSALAVFPRCHRGGI